MTKSIEVSGLEYIGGFPFSVYSSPDGTSRARIVAERMERTLAWLGDLVERPVPPLFVIGAEDWDRFALTPHYGLAHVNRTRIVMGQVPSGLWTDVLSSQWADLSEVDRGRIRGVYGEPADLTAFAELVISHELTHLADRPSHLDENPAGWWEQSRLLWFSELFANLGLHGYIVEEEPESLPALETLFEVVGNTPPERWTYHNLHEMYESASAPDMDGTNYVWFEFRLQILAKRLWEAGGREGFMRMHEALHGPVLPDNEIIKLLAEIDLGVSQEIETWSQSRNIAVR